MKILFLNIVFCFLICSVSNGQIPVHNNQFPQPISFNPNTILPFTAEELNKLQEVYSSSLEMEILNRPSRVLFMKEILRNRVVLKEIADPTKYKYFPLLSEVSLFKAYNPNLKRAVFFDPSTFNPIKYDFEFSSPSTQVFRVDNTNYFIIIKTQHYNKL